MGYMFSCSPFSKARIVGGRVVTVPVSDPDPKSHTPQIALLRWAWDGGDALGARRDNGLPQPGRHSNPRLCQTLTNLSAMGQLCLSCSHMAGSDTLQTDNRGHEFKFSVVAKKKKQQNVSVTVSERGTQADIVVVNVGIYMQKYPPDSNLI